LRPLLFTLPLFFIVVIGTLTLDNICNATLTRRVS
jgi:hypothetical protein